MSSIAISAPRTGTERVLAVLHRLALAGVGGLFLLAGLLKAGIFSTFAESTAAFLSLPAALATAAAAAVLLLEIVAGGALLINRRVRPAALVLSGLLVLFVIVLAIAAATGLQARCNCFGTTGLNLPFGAQIALDVVLLAVLAWIIRSEKRLAVA